LRRIDFLVGAAGLEPATR